MKKVHFKAGQLIFKEGDRSLEAYRILQGKVQIMIQGETKPIILAQLGDGDIFGEMGMVDEKPRSAGAVSLVETECEVMTPSDFQEIILQDPRRLLPYLATFFERLRTVTNRLNLEMRLRDQGAGSKPSISTASSAKSKISPPISFANHPERSRLHHMHASSSTTTEEPLEVEAIVFSTWNALCTSKFEAPFGDMAINKFPFRIGRLNHEDGSVFSSNDFSIPDKQPFQVSRNHCSIEREGDNYFVRDRGSTLGTIVNGVAIGVPYGKLTVDLKRGENTLIVGSQKSPYKFRIHLA